MRGREKLGGRETPVRKGLKTLGGVALHATAVAFPALVHTAWKDHREKTHRAIELKPWMNLAMDLVGGPFTDTNRWAAVHRIHHSTPDANLQPFVELADLMEWLNSHPDKLEEFPLPDTIAGIDPAVSQMTRDNKNIRQMTLDEANGVGSLARKLVDGWYEPQPEYSDDDIRRILYGEEPRYFYESPKGDRDGLPTIADGEKASLWDIRFLLRDPHSPALHPGGMAGIGQYNRKLYEDVVFFFRQNPQFMPPDIEFSKRELWIEDHKKAVRLSMVGANVLARLMIDRPRTAAGLAKSAFLGAGAAGLGTLGLIAGGNIVNSLGHGGEVRFASTQFWQDVANGKVRPRGDGTYETNNLWLSPETLGEVGGQLDHHGNPSLIAYVDGKEGTSNFKKWLIDPFGMATKMLAMHNIGMTVGNGFDGLRPDEPSDAIMRLEEIRRDIFAGG